VLGREGGVDITPTLLYAMVTLEVAGHVSVRSGTGAPPRSAVTAKSMSGRTHDASRLPSLDRAANPRCGDGVMWRCRGPPERQVVPADQPVVNDRLTFCMMVPHSLDNRCASALAISTRCNKHS
jgi:hypothetical protein